MSSRYGFGPEHRASSKKVKISADSFLSISSQKLGFSFMTLCFWKDVLFSSCAIPFKILLFDRLCVFSCWIWLSSLWCFSLHSYRRFVRNNTDNCTIALLHVPFSHLLSLFLLLSCSSSSFFCFHLYLFLHFLLLLTRPEILVERILMQEKDSYLNWTFCHCWVLDLPTHSSEFSPK